MGARGEEDEDGDGGDGGGRGALDEGGEGAAEVAVAAAAVAAPDVAVSSDYPLRLPTAGDQGSGAIRAAIVNGCQVHSCTVLGH
eukprot:SAG22_NODE_242_length_14104_cov_13.581935_13_plen_84_part_00